MKDKIVWISLIVFCSCQSAPDTAGSSRQDSVKSQPAMGVSPELKKLHFDYNKDPACGMPLHAGLLDSTTYKGKLYGFCSKECKEEFLKDPNSFVAQIK